MRRIRKLYLQNAAGERFGLNGETNVCVTSISGMGFALSPSFADLERGFFIPVGTESEPQGTPAFTVVFTRNPYRSYTAFVNWLFSAKTITLVYDPTGDQEYFRDLEVNFVQKGELNVVGWLEAPCAFYALTPWYQPSPTVLDLGSAGEDDSKRYTYVYDENLRYGIDSTAALSGVISGGGHVPGALDLVYRGAITNPKIRLIGNVSGKTYGVCSVTAVLNSTDTLKYSSRYENSFVKKVAADGTEIDLLDALDLSSGPFFHVPVDEPCTISIEADQSFVGSADLLLYYYYRSV